MTGQASLLLHFHARQLLDFLLEGVIVSALNIRISVFSRTLHPRLQGSMLYHWGLQPSFTTSLILTEFNLPKLSTNLMVSFRFE